MEHVSPFEALALADRRPAFPMVFFIDVLLEGPLERDRFARAVALASATYDFDELDLEYRALAEIPLRGLSPERAAGVAEAAEGVAERAAIDGRRELALASQDLAIRGWQRAGAKEACRRAMLRHAEITAGAPLEPPSP